MTFMTRGPQITRDVAGAEGGGTPPAPPAGDAAWHASITDAEVLGHIQLKGWDKLTPAEAAAQAAQAHRAAERHIGVPADQILRMPKDAADAEGWNALYGRLGRPADATGYDLSTIKVGDAALPENHETFLRQTAHALGLSKDAGTRLGSEFVKFLDGVNAAAEADFNAALETERTALKGDWGANFEGNRQLAAAFAAKHGIEPEAIAALEKVSGYKNAMNMLFKLAVATGEASFVDNGGGGNNQPLSYEMAVARKSELMADQEWVGRYQKGDATAAREFSAVCARIAAGKG